MATACPYPSETGGLPVRYHEDEIRAAIEASVDASGGGFSEWFIGVAADPDQRLFAHHRVRKYGDWWLRRRAVSREAALAVYCYFTRARGMAGEVEDHPAADSVYAFRKEPHTSP